MGILNSFQCDGREPNVDGERVTLTFQQAPQGSGQPHEVRITLGGEEIVLTANQTSELVRMWDAMSKAMGDVW